jgi:nucleotide-binding universal stress UspA family protein
MKLRDITVGVDFSPESHEAVQHATALAQQHDATLRLLHVVAPPISAAELGFGMPLASELEGSLSETLKKDKERLETLAKELGVKNATALTRDGLPDSTLCEAATEARSDLLVIGTHGRTGVKRFLLGSIAERVVRFSTVPVLVARPKELPGRYQKILIPTDFSPGSRPTVEYALKLATPTAHLTLFHAWQYPIGPGAYEMPVRLSGALVEGYAADYRQQAQTRARELLSNIAGADRVAFELTEGSPADAIVERAQNSDLVVMASHGHRGIRRFLLGSVAETVVRHAPCSVAVVHPPNPQ